MRFVWIFLGIFLGTQLVIVGINVYHDEDGWLWRGYPQERWMAKQMHQGYNIGQRQNFRIRALVSESIRQADSAPDVVVLGSSRAMQVGQAMLAHRGVRNHSISSARIIHYLSVLGQYAERGMQPRHVIIGVDPWIFKDEHLVIWPMERGAHVLSRQLGIDATQIGLRPSLPWASYFSGQKAWNTLTAQNTHGRCDQPELRRDENTPCAMRRYDGSLKYPADQIALTPEQVATEVQQGARGRMHSYDGYRELDPLRIQVFQDFLAFMQTKGIVVTLFLAPYHPLVQAHQTGRHDWQLTEQAQTVIRNIAAKLYIAVYGAYSAHAAGCSAQEFYDGIHARESCMTRLLAPLAQSLQAEKTTAVR